jgi:hypothetical protein
MNQIDGRPAAVAARSDLKSGVDARKRQRRLATLLAAARAKQHSGDHSET